MAPLFKAVDLEAQLLWFSADLHVQKNAFVELIEACATIESEFAGLVGRSRDEDRRARGLPPIDREKQEESSRGLSWLLADGRERTAKNWQQSKARLLRDADAGLIDTATVRLCRGAVSVEWTRSSVAFPGFGDTLRLSLAIGNITEAQLDLWYPEASLEPWVAVARNLVRVTGPQTKATAGFATVDSARVPYLFQMGGSEADPILRECVYGYYWTNLVGDAATVRLGGVERVLRDAPGVAKEAVGAASVYLELETRPWDVTDEQLIELRDFFEPALPPGTPRAWKPEWGKRPRVFEEHARVNRDEQHTAIETNQADCDRANQATRSLGPVSVPAIEVVVAESASPSELCVRLVLSESAKSDERIEIERAVEAWARLGALGAFAERDSELGYFRSASAPDWSDDGQSLSWRVDLGQAGSAAIEALTNTASHLARSGLPIRAIRIE